MGGASRLLGRTTDLATRKKLCIFHAELSREFLYDPCPKYEHAVCYCREMLGVSREMILETVVTLIVEKSTKRNVTCRLVKVG